MSAFTFMTEKNSTGKRLQCYLSHQEGKEQLNDCNALHNCTSLHHVVIPVCRRWAAGWQTQRTGNCAHEELGRHREGKLQANDCNAPRCYPCSMFADDELPADKHNWQPTKVVPNTQQTGNYLHSSHVHKNLTSPQTNSRAEHNPLSWFLKTADMYTSLVFLLVYIVILPCFHPTCITQVYLAPWAVSQLCSMSKN